MKSQFLQTGLVILIVSLFFIGYFSLSLVDAQPGDCSGEFECLQSENGDNKCDMTFYARPGSTTETGFIYKSTPFDIRISNVFDGVDYLENLDSKGEGELFFEFNGGQKEVEIVENEGGSPSTEWLQTSVENISYAVIGASYHDEYIDLDVDNENTTVTLVYKLGGEEMCRTSTLGVTRDPTDELEGVGSGCCTTDAQCKQWYGMGRFPLDAEGLSGQTSCGRSYKSKPNGACQSGLSCYHPFVNDKDQWDSSDPYGFINYDDEARDQIRSSPVVVDADLYGNTFEVYAFHIPDYVIRQDGEECYAGWDRCVVSSGSVCVPNDSSDDLAQCLKDCAPGDGDCVKGRYSNRVGDACDEDTYDTSNAGIILTSETMFNPDLTYEEFQQQCVPGCAEKYESFLDDANNDFYKRNIQADLEIFGYEVGDGFTANGFVCYAPTDTSVCEGIDTCGLSPSYDEENDSVTIDVIRTCMTDPPGVVYQLSASGLGGEDPRISETFGVEDRSVHSITFPGVSEDADTVEILVTALNSETEEPISTSCEMEWDLVHNPTGEGNPFIDSPGNTGDGPDITSIEGSNSFGMCRCPFVSDYYKKEEIWVTQECQDNPVTPDYSTLVSQLYDFDTGNRKGVIDINEAVGCIDCVRFNGTWTALGCLGTSPTSLFASLARIGIGVMGGVALLRLVYLGYLYQTGDESKISEARQGVLSTLGAIILVLFSVLILEIIGVNILDIIPSGFFG